MNTELQIDKIETSQFKTQNFESMNGRVTTFHADMLEVRVIEASCGHIEIQCTNDWQNQVDVSQVDISDADFIKILRSKIKLTISKADPLYLSAVGKMVVE